MSYPILWLARNNFLHQQQQQQQLWVHVSLMEPHLPLNRNADDDDGEDDDGGGGGGDGSV